jgi:hypothetical protein
MLSKPCCSTPPNPAPRYSKLIGSSDAQALAQYAKKHSPLATIAAGALKHNGWWRKSRSFRQNYESICCRTG